MDHGYRGLANYEIRELPEAAREALDRLYALKWLSGEPDVACICGEPVNTYSAAYCRKCVSRCAHAPMRGYVVTIDGTCRPRQRCGYCGIWFHDPPRQTWIYDVCFQDARDRREHRPPCERCGDERGTQEHHWAPRAIFSDFDDWPTSWLCVRCHSFWHSTMRAAGAYRLDWDARVSIDSAEVVG